MSFRERLTAWLGKRRPGEKSIDEKIERLGLHVLSDGKLMARLRDSDEFNMALKLAPEELLEEKKEQTEEGKKKGKRKTPRIKPEDKVRFYRDQMEELNTHLHKISVPYGRGGSEAPYAKLMLGWESLHAITMMIIDCVADSIRKVDVALKKKEATADQILLKKEELVDKLEYFLRMVSKKYASLVYAVSFYREDVSASYAVVMPPPVAAPGLSPREPYPAPLGRREEGERQQ